MVYVFSMYDLFFLFNAFFFLVFLSEFFLRNLAYIQTGRSFLFTYLLYSYSTLLR
jgi:hypothetical protein